MRKILVNTLIALFLLPAAAAWSQKIYVSKNVLKTAEWAGFKYNDKLKKALTSDQYAIRDFVEFSSLVDGVEGVEHAVSCLEIIPQVGDQTFGGSLMLSKPKLKKIVRDRLLLAQAKTQKADLKKPLESWAPITWAILNGTPLPESELEKVQKAHGKKHAEPSGMGNNADAQSPTVAPGSKQ